MLILDSFKITFSAMFQIFILGFCGYILAKKRIVSEDNLKLLSSLLINLFLPCFMFVKFVENFRFEIFSHWWVFVLLSFLVTLVGFFMGILFVKIDKNLEKFRREFVSLVAFQNSGYLPLILVALLVSPQRQAHMFINIALFLLGFNLVIWSGGVFYLVKEKTKGDELNLLFSPPAMAILVALFLIAIGFQSFIPNFLIGPARMFGDCALPLAMLVVGGNLAQMKVGLSDNFESILNLIIAKLLFLPFLFLGLIFLFRPPPEMAFLLLLESAVPSATSLSIIIRRHNIKDNIVSLGIFWTHIVSLVTIPIFLILFSLAKVIIYR